MNHRDFVVSCMDIAQQEARRIARIGLIRHRATLEDLVQDGLEQLLMNERTFRAGQSRSLARIVVRRRLLNLHVRREMSTTRIPIGGLFSLEKREHYIGSESHEEKVLDRVTVHHLERIVPVRLSQGRTRQSRAQALQRWVGQVKSHLRIAS